MDFSKLTAHQMQYLYEAALTYEAKLKATKKMVKELNAATVDVTQFIRGCEPEGTTILNSANQFKKGREDRSQYADMVMYGYTKYRLVRETKSSRVTGKNGIECNYSPVYRKDDDLWNVESGMMSRLLVSIKNGYADHYTMKKAVRDHCTFLRSRCSYIKGDAENNTELVTDECIFGD